MCLFIFEFFLISKLQNIFETASRCFVLILFHFKNDTMIHAIYLFLLWILMCMCLSRDTFSEPLKRWSTTHECEKCWKIKLKIRTQQKFKKYIFKMNGSAFYIFVYASLFSLHIQFPSVSASLSVCLTIYIYMFSLSKKTKRK